MNRSRAGATVIGLAAITACAVSAAGEMPRTLRYNRDVRQILSDKCFSCHGPDAKQRKAGLRLDLEEAAKAATESGARAVVPGQVEVSELVARVTSDEPTEQMPPPGSGKELTALEIATLKSWIEQGAEYEPHWAFITPERPDEPQVKLAGWVRNPIDRFVLAKLEAEGLAPSPEADRATVQRRLSLDLTGLPPEPAEIDEFLADESLGAYERVVERLLESPHYGERWGRTWLDAARYADSDGYEKDKPRVVWFYRDWVISALNRDMPYDQFVIEQLAGDLLPERTQDQLVATGFLRNSMINEEGGVDPEQFRMEAMFDRMDAVGTSVLGLTLRCAQCHTHKYDPISHEDYYRVFACLNGSSEGSVTVYTPEERLKRAEVLGAIEGIEEQLQAESPDWRERMACWVAGIRGNQPAWRVLSPTLDASGDQKHTVLEDGSILASGYAPTKFTTEFTVETDVERVTAVRLEAMTHPDLPHGGPGRSIEGTFALTEFRIVASPKGGVDGGKEVKIVRATADVNPVEAPLKPIYDDKSGKKRVTGPVQYAIDGVDETAWGIDLDPGRRNVPRCAVFVLEQPLEFPGGARLTIKLTQNHGGWNSDDNQTHNLGRFRFAVTDAADAAADVVDAELRQVVERSEPAASPEQERALFSVWRTSQEKWRPANERIEALWKQHPEGTSQLVLRERDVPRKTAVLDRGDFLKPVKPVEPGVPGFLNPPPAGETMDRLALARWMVDQKAPTTPRAIVNRLWQGHFGVGLVETSEDLGSQGAAPSHPELLDWLAVELVENGWKLKHLHRLIVGSATYRQSSKVRPELLALDPYNRLMARGARFRVDAEVVRDVALSASGLLDRTVGGPSAQPPAPAFLFVPPASYGPKVWKEAQGSERYRRAIYTFRFRSVPYPALQAFDAPNGDGACVRRSRSNTPLQALTGLNEPIFLECARALAVRSLREGGGSDAERLAFAMRRCTGRRPTPREEEVLLGLLRRQVERFSSERARPWDLAANDPSNPPALPEGSTPAEAAGWTAVARVLLNLDETVTRE